MLTDVGIDTSLYTTELALTREGPNENGALSLGAVDSTFTDDQKLVLSLTSPLSLLYATCFRTITLHFKPDPVSMLFLRVYRVPKLHRRRVE
jgi:hypothetical protein